GGSYLFFALAVDGEGVFEREVAAEDGIERIGTEFFRGSGVDGGFERDEGFLPIGVAGGRVFAGAVGDPLPDGGRNGFGHRGQLLVDLAVHGGQYVFRPERGFSGEKEEEQNAERVD